MSAFMPTAAQSAPRSERSIEQLDAAICRLARHLNAESYQLLVLVRDFDERFGWAKWSFPNCAEWLAWRCSVSLSAAREKVRTAHALRKLPAISAAFADGRLSYTKVRALTRVAQHHDEDLLLAYALQATAPQVEERCQQIRNSLPESAEGAHRTWQRRALAMWRRPEKGIATIKVELSIEEAELVSKALDRAVEAGDVSSGAEFDGNTWRAQQVDALVAIARSYLAGGAGASMACTDHCQVVVHVDASALHGGAGRADLPVETIKRLTCDGSLVTLVEDDRGTPLDVGRKQRTVSAALKRAVWSRDRGCTFPGCHRTHFVDAHHIRHWANGGETSLQNLTLLCTYHHRLLHEGGFTISRDSAGPICFRRADGRAIPRFGYQSDDVLDEPTTLDHTSAETWLNAVVNGRNPSTCMDSSSFARDLISGGRVSIAYVYPVSGCRARARDHDGFRALTP